MKKVAFVFRGGVSMRDRNTHKNQGYYGIANNKYEYVTFTATEKGLRHNLIENNPNYEIDFFIHSWNTDLEQELNRLYFPRKTLYESNDLYNNELVELIAKCQKGYLGTASQYLSMKKGIELVEDYSSTNNIKYDLIISWRLDVLLWGKVDLDTYNENYFYIGNFMETKTLDLHFVTGYKNRHLMKDIYHNLDKDCPPSPHDVIVNYFEKINQQDLLKLDDIVYRRDNEVIRILYNMYKEYRITKEQLEFYGLTVEDIMACVP